MSRSRAITVLDAPSNLGLRPPAEGVVPGCYKLPWALRDRNLLGLIGASDGGSLVPSRYYPQWTLGEGDRNAVAIAQYSLQLADRLEPLVKGGQQVLVLGGDCSILVGNMLALKRLGRYGLVYIDAHVDFRHAGNAEAIGAAAGEVLAIVTERGDARLVNLEGQGPYVHESDMHLVGVRPNDEYLGEIEALGISKTDSQELAERGVARAAEDVLTTVTRETLGFWIHLDLDVVDVSEMSAVDSPEADGPSFLTVAALLGPLLASPQCAGMQVTIYDPDLDPTGECADRIVKCLGQAFRAAQTADGN